MYRGDEDWGEGYGQEALARFQAMATTDPRARVWVGGMLHNLGVTAYARGELALAESRLEAALAGRLPSYVCLVGESGIRTRDDVLRLQQAGVHAVLVGETLMRAPDAGRKLDELRGATTAGVA